MNCEKHNVESCPECLELQSGDYIIVHKKLWTGRYEDVVMLWTPEKIVEVLALNEHKLEPTEYIVRKVSPIDIKMLRVNLIKDLNNHKTEIDRLNMLLSFIGEDI